MMLMIKQAMLAPGAYSDLLYSPNFQVAFNIVSTNISVPALVLFFLSIFFKIALIFISIIYLIDMALESRFQERLDADVLTVFLLFVKPRKLIFFVNVAKVFIQNKNGLNFEFRFKNEL